MRVSDRFNQVKALIQLCSKSEMDVILAHVASLKHSRNRGGEQIEKLLETISESPDIKSAEALRKVGSGVSSNANAFLLKVESAVLDGLSGTLNITRPGEFNNYFRNKGLNSEKLLQAEILLSKGELVTSDKLLRDVQSRAEKYECFDQALQAQRLLQQTMAHTSTEKAHAKFIEGIKKNEQKRRVLESAKDLYTELERAMSNPRSATNQTDVLLGKLQSLLKEEALDTVRYYYFQKLLQYQEHRADYAAAEDTAEQLLQVASEPPASMSNERRAMALDSRATIKAHLGKYAEALQDLEEAQKLQAKGSFENYISIKKQFFISFQHHTDTKALKSEINKQLRSKHTLRLPFALLQFQWFMSYQYYREGALKVTASNLMDEIRAFKSVSTELSYAQNYLLFIIGFELQHTEPKVAAKAQNMAVTNLNRLRKKGLLGSRAEKIAQTFDSLKNTRIANAKVRKTISEAAQMLENGSGEMAWSIFSPEIEPAQQWLKRSAGMLAPPGKRGRKKKATTA